MKEKKKVRLRFYVASIGPDGNAASCFEKLAALGAQSDLQSPLLIGEKILQVRRLMVSSDRKSVRGCVVRFRDDAPLTGARDKLDESPVQLADGHELIERNHFVLFQERPGHEVLVFQPSVEGAHISNFARYLTQLFGLEHSVYFNDIFTEDGYNALLKGSVVKSVEFRVAKPKSKFFAPDPNDTWTKESIEFMNATGATTFSAKISTKSRTGGLLDPVRQKIKSLLESDQTRALKVKISDQESPIDLFSDRIYQDVFVPIAERNIVSSDMFQAIFDAKEKTQPQLDAIFGLGDEALQ